MAAVGVERGGGGGPEVAAAAVAVAGGELQLLVVAKLHLDGGCLQGGGGAWALAEHPVGERCTRAVKSAAAPAAGVCSPGSAGAGFPARAEAALAGEDCRAVPSPWAAAWSTGSPADGVPSRRAA